MIFSIFLQSCFYWNFHSWFIGTWFWNSVELLNELICGCIVRVSRKFGIDLVENVEIQKNICDLCSTVKLRIAEFYCGFVLCIRYCTMETKRKRAPNYSSGEKELLISLVNKYKMVIENKKTDAVMVSEKNEAWFKITQEFNSVSPNNVFRPTDSLKKYWENIKDDVRRRAGQDRTSLYKTGGGPPSPKIKKPEEDVLLGIINKKTIMGLENPFDNDCLDENHSENAITQVCSSTYILTFYINININILVLGNWYW